MPSTLCLILITLGIISAAVSGANQPSETTVIDTKNVTTSTIAPPTTNATTAVPFTNATTAAPNITTSAAPITSTVTPPTTQAPTTPPPHKDGLWIVKDPVTNRICLVAQMKILLDIPYTNKTGQVVMTHVAVPGNATSVGNCSTTDVTRPQTLTLSWGAPNISVLTLTFNSNKTSGQFWLDSIAASVSVDNKTFPAIRGEVKQIKMVNSTKHFVTPLKSSYDCPTKLNIPASVIPPVIKTSAYFTLDHFHLEAFKDSDKENFSNAIYCEGGSSPDLVPILVGCTLVGLVVIVLAVYLWGRRRSQARGYLSM